MFTHVCVILELQHRKMQVIYRQNYLTKLVLNLIVVKNNFIYCVFVQIGVTWKGQWTAQSCEICQCLKKGNNRAQVMCDRTICNACPQVRFHLYKTQLSCPTFIINIITPSQPSSLNIINLHHAYQRIIIIPSSHSTPTPFLIKPTT